MHFRFDQHFIYKDYANIINIKLLFLKNRVLKC